MLIACPGCDRRYQIADAAIGDTGRSVRCSRCATVWTAQAEAAIQIEASLAAAAHPEMMSRRPALAPASSLAGEEPAVLHGLPPAGAPAALPPAILPAGLSGPLGIDEDELGHAAVLDGTAEALAPETPGLNPGRVRRGLGARKRAARPSLAARTIPAVRRLRLPRGSGVAAGLAALAAAMVFRTGVVVAFPATGTLYAHLGLPVNLRGIEIAEVHGRALAQDGGPPALVVEGSLSTAGKAARSVPRLRVGVNDPEGAEIASFLVPPPRAVLEPGERADFSLQFPNLSERASAVTVRFEDRHARVAPSSLPTQVRNPEGREPDAHAPHAGEPQAGHQS